MLFLLLQFNIDTWNHNTGDFYHVRGIAEKMGIKKTYNMMISDKHFHPNLRISSHVQ